MGLQIFKIRFRFPDPLRGSPADAPLSGLLRSRGGDRGAPHCSCGAAGLAPGSPEWGTPGARGRRARGCPRAGLRATRGCASVRCWGLFPNLLKRLSSIAEFAPIFSATGRGSVSPTLPEHLLNFPALVSVFPDPAGSPYIGDARYWHPLLCGFGCTFKAISQVICSVSPSHLWALTSEISSLL